MQHKQHRDSPFKQTVRLKQHSPIIHFQHEQEGATLRATELKPRIDGFIVQKLGGRVRKEFIQKKEDGHLALAYKLRISAKEDKKYLVASFISKHLRQEFDSQEIGYLHSAPYFADNEFVKNRRLDEARRAVSYRDIQLEVFSFHPDLVSLVLEALPYVLAFNNFGTRQSKGFGSFSLEGAAAEDFEGMLLNQAMSGYEKVLYFPVGQGAGIEEVFQKIDSEYKVLKSGDRNDDSQMREYFEEKGIQWEKPTIKRELVRSRHPAKNDFTKDDNVKYIRALLGLAELYEFPKDGRAKVKIRHLGGKIERFRSPLTFKIFGNTIYILVGSIPDDLYGATFEFENEGRKILINTPPKGTFDLYQFLEDHVENTWGYVKG